MLQHIDRIDALKITLTEKKLGVMFSMDFNTDVLTLNNDLDVIKNGLITYQEIEKKLNACNLL